MKLNYTRKGAHSAFTLIEMIGVLAVIAILAALLIPKVFAAINNAKISNTSTTLNTVKTAAIDHYAKFGSLTASSTTNSLALPVEQYDKILLGEGFLDKLFAVKIGDGVNSPTNTTVRLSLGLISTTAATGANAAYNLDGDATDTAENDASGSYVLEALIKAVTLSDAKDLNRIVDGTDSNLAAPDDTSADEAGRVKYTAPSPGGLVDVLVYLTHR